jgi:hypothetical protein
MEDRMMMLERAIVAGASNTSMATNDNDDGTSGITDNQSVPSTGNSTTSAGGYLRQRRNNQGERTGQNSNN